MCSFWKIPVGLHRDATWKILHTFCHCLWKIYDGLLPENWGQMHYTQEKSELTFLCSCASPWTTLVAHPLRTTRVQCSLRPAAMGRVTTTQLFTPFLPWVPGGLVSLQWRWTTLYMSRVPGPGLRCLLLSLASLSWPLAGGWSISTALAAGDTLAYETPFSPHVPRCLLLVLWPPAACCGGFCGPTVLSLNGVMTRIWCRLSPRPGMCLHAEQPHPWPSGVFV